MAQHSAAILPQKGGPLKIEKRNTPEPGANEILVEIKAVALNPIDYYQRDFGLPPIAQYPTIIGCDAAGIVARVGSNVSNAPAVGTRVAGMASGFYHNNSPDHGAFQQYALAQPEAMAAIPDSLSFEQAAMIPLGFMTALTAWTTIGISLETRFSPEEKQAVLIWGASSSVGTYAVQSARTLGFRIYATASSKHHEYIKKLGADHVFDYKDSDVISQIVRQVKADGVKLQTAHAVVPGSLEPVLDVLKETKGDGKAAVALSSSMPPDHLKLDNTRILFTMPSMDKAVRDEHLAKCFHSWLANGLKDGSIVPSPEPQIEDGGIEGISAALDKLKAGVSCTKIVVPL